MKIVVLESPFAGPTPEAIEENIKFARACVRDCLKRGEAPLASHLLYTQEGILRDEIPEERALGIEAGLVVGRLAEATVVYTDRGISRGMQYGIDRAKIRGKTCRISKIGARIKKFALVDNGDKVWIESTLIKKFNTSVFLALVVA